MSATGSLTITLPVDLADLVRRKVASGEFPSESDVIREGLAVLAARDGVVDDWLRGEVASIYDRVIADPDGETSAADEVFDAIRRRHRDRQAGPAA